MNVNIPVLPTNIMYKYTLDNSVFPILAFKMKICDNYIPMKQHYFTEFNHF